jgi:hypothetical protein
MNGLAVEQRTEDRRPATGEVCLALEGPAPAEFRGQLVDSSRSGFRAVHSQAALSTGQRLRFRHAFGTGRVVVVWNRILADCVESGFLILENRVTVTRCCAS